MRHGPRWIPNVNLPGANEAKSPSSIDRFFWARGTKFIGYSGNAWLGVAIVGGSHGIAAVVFSILALAIPRFPVVLAFIFGGVALTTLIIALFMARRQKKSPQAEVRISSQGRKLLYKIGQHIGWYDQETRRAHHNHGFGLLWQTMFGIKTASNVLNPKSAEVLEAGCAEYNRLAGLLKLAKDSEGRSTNLSPQIKVASDEAIVSLINQVALIEESPESEATIIIHCNNQIAKLKELANRYEQLLSGPTTIADRLSSTTVMDNVLDQLRMEAQAQEELRIMNRQD